MIVSLSSKDKQPHPLPSVTTTHRERKCKGDTKQKTVIVTG